MWQKWENMIFWKKWFFLKYFMKLLFCVFSCIERCIHCVKILIFRKFHKIVFFACSYLCQHFFWLGNDFIVLRASPAVTWLTVYRWLSVPEWWSIWWYRSKIFCTRGQFFLLCSQPFSYRIYWYSKGQQLYM